MTEPTPEFSRVIEPPRAIGSVAMHRIGAGAEERAALGRRFDLLALDRLEAEVRLERLEDNLVRLDATFSADVVQSCIVTLEPVPSAVGEPFTLLYGAAETGRSIELDGEAETIEPLENDRIDIGEAVAQQLSLALDPFPRHPDAAS